MKTIGIIAAALISLPSQVGAATYCDFNIQANCPPPTADAEFPAEEMKIACLKDMAPFANESDDLKQAILTSCIGYARTRFEMAHAAQVNITPP
jgi:hypothetical protein